jgi:TfoX/Sxy family transcriptional regulator of competence genes
MAYDQATADRVRRILAGRPGVEEKRMVGGVSFLVDGVMCMGVTATGLMVRVGAEARDRVLRQRNVRPMELGGKPLAGFVVVEPAGYRTEAALAKWVGRGVDFGSTLPPKTAGKAERLFGAIRGRWLPEPGVTEGTGFGSNPGLRVGSKIFAMLQGDHLVVKLPRPRVDQLVEDGTAARFDPRRDGRAMKEWATIPVERGRLWGRLAEESLRFVRNAAKRRKPRGAAGPVGRSR